jgi:transcriptional regulator with XRE-family HTH domain
MTIKQIGKKLFALREHRGWTMRTLASKAGVAPSSVLRAEAGHTVTSHVLASLARALGAKFELVTKHRKLPLSN